MADDLIGMKDDRIHLITKVCYLYYNEYLTQSEIANQLGITRQMVSRLLQRAKKEGIVQIQINSPTISIADFEVKLEKRYHLKKAIVIQDANISPQDLKDKLGIASAKYLQEVLAPGLKIGLGWGTTLRAMAEYFSRNNNTIMPRIEAIQLMGGMNNVEYNVLAQDIVRLIAMSLEAEDYYLLAPCIVRDQRMRDMFLKENSIGKVFDKYSELDYAFVGMGAISADSIVAKSGNITSDEINSLSEMGAVGEVCLRYLDQQGNFLAAPLNKRIISIEIEQLKKVKNVVATGGGIDKCQAVLGVLNSKVVNVLITDENVAKFLIGSPE
jgi:deoxyribonucleoside regulator